MLVGDASLIAHFGKHTEANNYIKANTFTTVYKISTPSCQHTRIQMIHFNVCVCSLIAKPLHMPDLQPHK